MEKLKQGIKNALVIYGAINENWKIEIVDKEILSHSDWAKVTVYTYRPRCKKPDGSWNLAVNMVREIVDFEKSTYTRL